MKDLGINIKELRQEKGITQEELAEMTNMNLRTIQRIENNETTPRGNSLNAICDALQVELTDLTPANNRSAENRIVKIIAEIVFLISLNIAIMAVFGFLTLDTAANRNSRLGAYLLSVFIPFAIIFITPSMNPIKRVLKFGAGLIVYMIMALILITFPEPVSIMKGLIPSIIIYLAILFYGNLILKMIRI
ncbi:MAG: helix-turn-helix transcriptional regulator [Bacteroidales bacterium]|jgi:transcriptional regulator with XRE-family HTH domain|nr:helix-turn-helix transcriptional regulator [Bacteroidales bacterium]